MESVIFADAEVTTTKRCPLFFGHMTMGVRRKKRKKQNNEDTYDDDKKYHDSFSVSMRLGEK